jgi:hypothetical protein
MAGAQTSRLDALVEVLRPVLPYPVADANGDLPAGGGAQAPWFVIWPAAGDPRVIVRANPLHPDTQRAGAEAMRGIQEAVIAAERKAQASYERALEEIRRKGTVSSDLTEISLDDEGVAGERIDAELELTVAIDDAPASFEIGTATEPTVSDATAGPSYVVHIPANPYRDTTADGVRARFRPAEARLFFGLTARPTVTGRGADRFSVGIQPNRGLWAVTIRGNETLLKHLLANSDWTRLAR